LLAKSKVTGHSIGIYPEIKHSTYHAEVKDANDHQLFGQHIFENKLLKKLHEANGIDRNGDGKITINDRRVDGLFTDFADTCVEARDTSTNVSTDSIWPGQCKHQ